MKKILGFLIGFVLVSGLVASSPAQAADATVEQRAAALFLHLKSVGYRDVRLVVGRYGPLESTYHIWVMLKDTDGTYLLDPSLQLRARRIDEIPPGLYLPYYSFDERQAYSHLSGVPMPVQTIPIRNPKHS